MSCSECRKVQTGLIRLMSLSTTGLEDCHGKSASRQSDTKGGCETLLINDAENNKAPTHQL